MKSVTVDRLRELLQYDPATGAFTWLPRPLEDFADENRGKVWNVRWPGKVAGSPCNGYIAISINKRLHKAHRLAFLYMTGEWPKGEVDHRNGVKTDNRWENLRDVTHQVNSQNTRAARGAATGLLGAYIEKSTGRFFSSICVDGRLRWLGYHPTAESAHAAYVAAKREFHEGCTL